MHGGLRPRHRYVGVLDLPDQQHAHRLTGGVLRPRQPQSWPRVHAGLHGVLSTPTRNTQGPGFGWALFIGEITMRFACLAALLVGCITPDESVPPPPIARIASYRCTAPLSVPSGEWLYATHEAHIYPDGSTLATCEVAGREVSISGV